MIKITFLNNGEKVASAPEDSNLLRVSIREQGGIPFKCGGGICGTCKCKIEKGLENTDVVKPKERNHLTDAELAEGYRMACQTFLRGDVQVSWNSDSAKTKTRRLSAAGNPARESADP